MDWHVPQRFNFRFAVQIAFSFGLIFSYSAAWADPVPDSGSSSDSLSRQIDQLGSGSFVDRQHAMDELRDAGDGSIPFLIGELARRDYETQRRLLFVLTEFAFTRPGRVEERVVSELEKLKASSDEEFARYIEETLAAIRSYQQESAELEIESSGGTIENGDRSLVVRFGRGWRGSVEKIALAARLGKVGVISIERSNLGDSCLEYVARMPSITMLFLGDSRVHGRDLGKLATLQQLSYLSLRNLELDPDAIHELAALSSLQSLGLDGTTITDEGLVHLKSFPQLKTLWLDNTAITERGLTSIAKLGNLTALHMAKTMVSGEGLKKLHECPSLEYLSLKGVELTVDDMKRLSGLSQLKTLGLDHANITDEHLEKLRDLPALRTLWLSRTKVTDECIDDLLRFSDLEVLYLHAAEISEHGIERLKKELPNCRIYH